MPGKSPKNKAISVRFSDGEKALIERQAGAEHLAPATWARYILLQEATKGVTKRLGERAQQRRGKT